MVRPWGVTPVSDHAGMHHKELFEYRIIRTKDFIWNINLCRTVIVFTAVWLMLSSKFTSLSRSAERNGVEYVPQKKRQYDIIYVTKGAIYITLGM